MCSLEATEEKLIPVMKKVLRQFYGEKPEDSKDYCRIGELAPPMFLYHFFNTRSLFTTPGSVERFARQEWRHRCSWRQERRSNQVFFASVSKRRLKMINTSTFLFWTWTDSWSRQLWLEWPGRILSCRWQSWQSWKSWQFWQSQQSFLSKTKDYWISAVVRLHGHAQ